jgi:hypothetical protein
MGIAPPPATRQKAPSLVTAAVTLSAVPVRGMVLDVEVDVLVEIEVVIAVLNTAPATLAPASVRAAYFRTSTRVKGGCFRGFRGRPRQRGNPLKSPTFIYFGEVGSPRRCCPCRVLKSKHKKRNDGHCGPSPAMLRVHSYSRCFSAMPLAVLHCFRVSPWTTSDHHPKTGCPPL